MPPKISALIGIAAGADPAGLAVLLAFAAALGISAYSSMAALLMTTFSRSLTEQRKMMRVSDSRHISVTRVSPGKTLSAKRTLMLLK